MIAVIRLGASGTSRKGTTAFTRGPTSMRMHDHVNTEPTTPSAVPVPTNSHHGVAPPRARAAQKTDNPNGIT